MSATQRTGSLGIGRRWWWIGPLAWLLTTGKVIAVEPEVVLLQDATRYATTPEKKARKAAARAELRERGADGLRLLMRHAHLENLGLHELAMERALNLEVGQAVPVLAEFLRADHPATRRLAVYFLGFHPAPELAAQVRPLLADEETCGAAIRTLGKWRVREAVPEILPFLRHERETRRIAAANALRDIGDPASAPDLLTALSDPVFTVREAAARALTGLGPPAEQALMAALPQAADPARRHIIRTLGLMRSKRAIHALSRLLLDPDPYVRRDADEAVRRIQSGAPE